MNNMYLPFWKWQGAGNDFILLDGIRANMPSLQPHHIQSWCRRRTGIGADGLLLLLPPTEPEAHVRMQFFNPDGQEAGMCGNGARCLARFAVTQALAPANLSMQTATGLVRATVQQDASVCLDLPPPDLPRLDVQVPVENQTYTIDVADTGVPHAIVVCDDIETAPLTTLAPALRYHPAFAPAGTNVDFIQIMPDLSLRIRTYERGVESETLACGTGMAAAGLISILRSRAPSPVNIQCAGGDTLLVAAKIQADTVLSLSLTGPALEVFSGNLPFEPAPKEP